jgi:hypothetical protein
VSPSVANFRFTGIPFRTRDGESWTMQCLQNTKQQTGNGLLNCEATSPTYRTLPTDFHFQYVFAKGSKTNDFKRYELDDDCSQNTNSEPRSTYRMVKFLSLGGATYRRFPLPVPISQPESVVKFVQLSLKTMRAGRKMPKRTPIAIPGQPIDWSCYFS